MTAKRFVNIEGEMLYDTAGEMESIYHNERVCFSELCEFLNEMHEENQQLRQQVNGLIESIQESAKISAESITKQYANKNNGDFIK